MFRTHLVRAIVGGALAAAVLPVAAGSALASRAPADTTAGPAAAHVCDPGWFCVHERDTSGNYHWYDYYDCGVWHPMHGVPTWYDNHQYDGARGTFRYPDGTDWYTPPPKSSGRPLHYPYDSPRLTAPTAVLPC